MLKDFFSKFLQSSLVRKLKQFDKKTILVFLKNFFQVMKFVQCISIIELNRFGSSKLAILSVKIRVKFSSTKSALYSGNLCPDLDLSLDFNMIINGTIS